MKRHKATASLLAAFLVLVCSVIAFAQDIEWKTIRPGGQEFTVEMPGLPTREGRIVLIEKDTKLAPNVYDLVVNKVRYQIMSFGHTSPVSTPQDFSIFVERFHRAFVAGNDRMPKSITFEKDLVGLNRAAQQFQLKVDNHNGLVRLYDGEHYFYAVMVIGGGESDSVVSRFLSSFKLSKLNTQFPDRSSGDVLQPKEPPEPWSGQLPGNMAPVNAGILNGKAIELPFAKYPNEARKSRASGRVTVKVLVDEQGNVISAEAIDGPDVLREAATKAAWKARFSQTRLMGQPVKVFGSAGVCICLRPLMNCFLAG
jgi:TonB family protein